MPNFALLGSSRQPTLREKIFLILWCWPYYLLPCLAVYQNIIEGNSLYAVAIITAQVEVVILSIWWLLPSKKEGKEKKSIPSE